MTQAHGRLLHTGLQNYDHVELDAGEIFFAQALRARLCPCCSIALVAFAHDLSPPPAPGFIQVSWLNLEICPGCGWWHFHCDMDVGNGFGDGQIDKATYWELTHALQAEINLGSHTLPIDELQRHLARRWDDRKLISAQQAEDLVASLLQEHHGGQIVRVTANANTADGGIDLYLAARDDGSIQRAVQVKRRITSDVETVKEVRNFVGAMVLERHDHGIFVTTATRFSKAAQGVKGMAKEAKFKLELELIDGERLLEMLSASNATKPAQLPRYVQLDQEWRDTRGRTVSARDLFIGDMRQWAA